MNWRTIMKYNNYTLSYDKYMVGEFYDEITEELIEALGLILKFHHTFINTKLTDEEVRNFNIPTPELVYVEGIGDTRLYKLVDLVFNKDKREISLNCHPFIEGKVQIVEYEKYIDSRYYQISEEEFKRLFFDNYEKISVYEQQTGAFIINII